MTSSFTVKIDHAKIDREIQETVDARIESEKASIINNTMRELFKAPNHFEKKGGVMHQLLRERVEELALEAIGNIDVERVRKDFDRLFTKYYDEHLPVAVERAARKAAYQAAESTANAKVKK